MQDINQESTSNWEELYTKAFSYRFSNIAKQADKGQDFLYGKGLARLQIDIKDFIELERQKAKEEVVKECLNILEQQNPINWDEEVNHYKERIKNLSKQ